MKRRMLMMLLPMAMCGCERIEQQAQQDKAVSEFNNAVSHLENANAGYNRSGTLDPTTVKGGVSDDSLFGKVTGLKEGQSYEDYRRAQLEAATAALNNLGSSGTPAQQMATMLTLSEIHATIAREHATNASRQWATETMQPAQLFDTLNALRDSKTSANAYAKISYENVLARLNIEINTAEAQVDDVSKEIAALEKELEGLQAEIKTNQEGQAKFEKESGDAKRKAFTAKGQLAFDLEKTAAESLLKADQHSMTIERLNARADLIQSKLRVQNILLKQAQDNITNAKDAVAEIKKREMSTTELQTAAANLATKREEAFNKVFADVVKNQSEDVLKSYDAAMAAFDQAIKFAEQSQNKASSIKNDRVNPGGAAEARARSAFQLADVQSQKAHYLKQYESTLSGYATLLTQLTNAASGDLVESTLITQFGELKAKATEAADKAKQDATELLRSAVQNYQQAADEANDSNSNPFKTQVNAEATARKNQAQTTLSQLTGEPAPTNGNPVTPPDNTTPPDNGTTPPDNTTPPADGTTSPDNTTPAPTN